MAEYEQAVFISYAWGGESEEIVNQIDQVLQQRGLKIIRDKRDLGYKGSISAFMERIGQGNCVIVVISDKYLRSSNCMFELVEIAEVKQFHDRVFPIVLSNAEIYDPIKRLEYVKYWELKRGELAQAMKDVDPANLQGIREDMDLYDRIRDKVSGLTSILKDMNTLAPDMHKDSDFREIYAGIEKRMAGATKESQKRYQEELSQKAIEKTIQKPSSTSYKNRLATARILLISQRPSQVWLGMEEVRLQLQEDPENKDIYSLLLDVVQEKRDLRERVRSIFVEMMQNGSKSAELALHVLPGTITDLLDEADDKYYAGEFDRALILYQKVLKLDPENTRAKNQIVKAETRKSTGESTSYLPRIAEQYYRYARSHIAARDIVTAINLLNAAIEAAHANGMEYPEAEEALQDMQSLLSAGELWEKAKIAISEAHWKDAVDLYIKSILFDPANEVIKKELESLQDLLMVETAIKKHGIMKILMPINQIQTTVETAQVLMNNANPLINFIERQLNQIRILRILIGVILLILLGIFIYQIF